jgi:hypothetical protein
LRGRYNERGDFLITTTPAIPEDTVPDLEPLYIPHIVNGGGYTTQFVMFRATAQSTGTSLFVKAEYFDQHKTLRQRLPDEPPAACADGCADSKLPPSSRSARQQEIADVRAGNKQHRENGSQQDP